MQGTVDYSAISTQPPVFPESPTIQFQEDVPAWLEADFNSRRASSDIEYFVANIVFPTPVILDDFLISMLKVENGAMDFRELSRFSTSIFEIDYMGRKYA